MSVTTLILIVLAVFAGLVIMAVFLNKPIKPAVSASARPAAASRRTSTSTASRTSSDRRRREDDDDLLNPLNPASPMGMAAMMAMVDDADGPSRSSSPAQSCEPEPAPAETTRTYGGSSYGGDSSSYGGSSDSYNSGGSDFGGGGGCD